MAFSEDDIRRLAELAQLRLAADEAARAAADLGVLVAYVAQIQAVDVEGASETVHAGGLAAALRPDVVRPGMSRHVLMRDAPSADSGLFEVPRVISRGSRNAGADDDPGDAGS